jgi:hypothetical protein
MHGSISRRWEVGFSRFSCRSPSHYCIYYHPSNCIYRDTYLGAPTAMWPQYRNPIWPLIFLFSLSTSVISVEIARFTEYGWVEAFDKTPSQNGQIEEMALGGGAMQVPMNGNSKGWWARWLAVGGEGDVTVHVSRSRPK